VRVTIDHDLLATAVGQVARVLPARPVTPILAGIRIAASGGSATLSAYDYEASVTTQVTADTAQDGTVVVAGRLLHEILKALPGKPVDLSADGSRLTLTCGASVFTLMLLPADQYPSLPELPPLAGTLGSDLLATAIGQVAVAAGRDDTLPALTGIRVAADGGQLTLVATDRYRLAVRTLAWRPAPDDEQASAVLIPAQALTDVARAAAAAAETAIFLTPPGDSGKEPSIAGFQAGAWRATTRLIAGEFPRHEDKIPARLTATADVPAGSFADAVRRVALVAERNTPVRITFSGAQARLEAATGNEASATEETDARLDGADEASVAFNPQYLLDGLTAASADTGTVRIGLGGANKPALITPADDPDSYQYVLVPQRIAE
jgi:DNA polymerase III subunit beta